MNYANVLGEAKGKFGAWTAWYVLGEAATGYAVRAQLAPDLTVNPFTDTDIYGAVKEMNSTQRPAGFDGAARKIHTPRSVYWWQPPSDTRDAAVIASIAERVRRFLNDDWSYVGLLVEVRHPPCTLCGESRVTSAGLWGIESDSDDGYVIETLGDLVNEAKDE